jgi:hypothetical protein
MKHIIFASLIAASLMTGCNSEANIEDKPTKNSRIETVEEVEGLKIFGQGCEIYQEGDTFEKNGMVITVNSSRLTKQRGNWVNYADFYPEDDENGLIIDESCYLVINMTIEVKDRANYLGFCGLYNYCVDKKTGEYVDGGSMTSSTYYNSMNINAELECDLFTEYPKDGELIKNQDFVFYILDDKNITDENIFCLEVEDSTGVLVNHSGIEHVALVELNPTNEI